MDNNVDAILGITTTENSQVPFIVNLINTLKDNQLISEGITIPFLIGAYKIQENDTTIPTLDYLKSTLQKIINSLGEYKLFIKTCSNINQYVISIIGDKDIDIIGNDAPYPYIADSSGCKVLFFEEYFDIQAPSIENVSVFFWGKYVNELLDEKYSYAERAWRSFSDEELICIRRSICSDANDSNLPQRNSGPRTKSQIIANELKFLTKALGLIILGIILFATIYGYAKYPLQVSDENQRKFNLEMLKLDSNFGSAYVEYLGICSYDSHFHDDWKFQHINSSRKSAWESDVMRTTWGIFFIALGLITVARYIFYGIRSIVRWVNNNATN